MTCPPESLRIGGEFEFEPDAYRGEGAQAPVWATWPHRTWTDTGRSALLLVARAILRRGGKKRVWLPAYGCESISQPFRQAGFDLHYYSVGTDLMEGRIQPDSGESLLFIHYFGHRNLRMVAAAERYRAAGVWVIEDSVQTSLVEAPAAGDFGLTSYRKLLPVPDGAVLLSQHSVDMTPPEMTLAEPDEAFVSAKLIGKILRGSEAAAADFLPLLEEAESRLEERIVPRRRSWLSGWMLAHLDLHDAAAKRRANWLALTRLIEAAGLDDRLQPVFRTLADEDVPLGLPIRVAGGQRDRLRSFLAGEDIYCPVHWPLEHLPDDTAFASDRDLAASILTLPVDQRLSPAHLERMVQALIRFFREAR